MRLWEALGSPPLADPLPARRSRSWACHGWALQRLLLPTGLPKIRCPAMLWRLLHSAPFSRLFTWQDLCQDFVLSDLIAPLRALRRVAHPPLFSWNLRHMRDSRTTNNQQKSHIIFSASARSRAAFLQETHWSEYDARAWDSMLQGRRVFVAPAVPSPEGGGGLAGGGLPLSSPMIMWTRAPPF